MPSPRKGRVFWPTLPWKLILVIAAALLGLGLSLWILRDR
jgi:hypothetical protein